MGNYDFGKDLKIATKTEIEVAELLEDKYHTSFIGFSNKNDYDILVEKDGNYISYEVKEDFMCKFTENVALEFACRGKPSGISVSRADFYIYKIHTKHNGIRFFEYKTSILKEMIDNKLFFTIVNGGDKNSNSMNYLFKYEVFKKYGNDITPAA